MKALVSIVCGMMSFVMISMAQVKAYTQSTSQILDSGSSIVSIDWKIKMLTGAIALLSIAYSIYYTRSGQTKLNIVNRVGRLLALLAIILCVIPVYKIYVR